MLTEQDRGAYTPQSDAPLAFDARRAKGGGPGSTMLVLSGVILMALIIAVLLVYRHGARHAGQPPQLVGAPVGQTKEVAASDAQPTDQTAGLQVYKTEMPPTNEAQPAPTFAPGPEQPRPIPPARAPIAAPTAPVLSAPLRPAISPTSPVKAPTPPVKVAASPAPVVKPAPPPKSKAAPVEDNNYVAGSAFSANPSPPAKAASPTAVPPVAVKPKPAPKSAAAPASSAAAGGGAMVQIGAFSSAALADKGWRDVGAALPGRLSGKTKKVETASKDGHTFYRTSVGGFASRADADSFCAALKAAGHTCFVR